tara:strand:+ start:612 stop:986 length:375 start_codon:yes stop_codon:yes gene_type:complete
MSSGYFPTFSYGKYSDNMSEYPINIFTHGVICGCSGKTYNNRCSFSSQHIKTKKHIKWVETLNKEFYEINKNNSTCNSKHICVICTDNLNENALSLPCAHTFCTDCINQWLKIKPECPICKERV